MAVFTYPGVYIEEVPSGVRTISGVATSIALFIGWSARGPIDKAVRITSFADYERQFGSLDLRTLLPYAVKQFYDNGGADAYVIRIASTAAKPASVTAGSLTVTASSPGAWANTHRVRITRRADDATRFKLEILDHPTKESVIELFENLSMSPADARFIEPVVNDRSSAIRVTATGTTTPANAVVDLDATTPGADGPVLDPNGEDAANQAAFHAAVQAQFDDGSIADRLDLFNLVCVPGETDPATIADLQAKCLAKRAFVIVDCAENATVASLNAPLPTAVVGDPAKNSALYFPWVKAPDPLQSGAVRTFPPCGFVAGVIARTDAQRGVWKAAAGTDASLNGAIGLAVAMNDRENGQLNPRGINCLRTMPVYGNIVWGSRTLHGDNDRASEWKYVPVRRLALFLEESLYRGTKWVVFEPNDEPLWAQIRLNVGAFMHDLFRQGAFQGTSPREAYFVRCDRTTTTQTDINLGVVNILVGFAPLKPAEFVVIKLQQMAGEIQT
jgi:hypothetical protein